jgi:pilus assembly protein CpaC
LPVVGIPFRKVQEEVNEIENLVLVTPDFADAMDPHEVPPCGPGMETMSPSHSELYCKGMIEVPACGPCGASEPCVCTAPGLGCNVGGAAAGFGPHVAPMGAAAMATDSLPPGATPFYGPAMGVPLETIEPTPADSAAPNGTPVQPQESAVPSGAQPPDPAASRPRPQWQRTAGAPMNRNIRPNPVVGPTLSGPATSTPGLIGPIGYDVQK